MRRASIALLTLLASCFSFVKSDEKFTLIGSRTIQHGSRYGIYVDDSMLDYGTSVTIRLRGQHSLTRRVEARNETQQNVIEFNLNENRLANEYKLAVLSHRDGMCAYDEFPIFPVRKEYSVFIQLDKPIYKPKDAIRFRIVMIDEQTRPFKPKSLQVKLTNARSETVKEFMVRDNEVKMGIYQNKFDLPESASLGMWNLSVIVNGLKNDVIMETFEVKKFIMPLINVNIDAKPYLFHTDTLLRLAIAAKYSFGLTAKGSAVVRVKVYDSDRIVIQTATKNINNIDAEMKVDFDVENDLRIKLTDPDRIIQIVVDFTDSSSGEKFSKVKEISLRHKNSFNIKIYNPKKFTAGSLYEFYASVKDIDGLPQDTKSYPLIMRCQYANDNFRVTLSAFLDKGLAKFSWFVPDYVTELKITVSYRDSSKSFDISRGNDSKNYNFDTTIITKQPSLKEDVRVELKSVNNIGSVSYAVVGRLGLAVAGNFECHSVACQFSFQPNENMLPESSLIVYYVNADGDVIYDTTKVHFEEFSSNYLNITTAAGSNAKPGSQISIDLNSMPNSLVALLGIDESLAHLQTGNDIDDFDVTMDLLTYGHTDFTFNHPQVKLMQKSFVYYQNFKNLHPCSAEEVAMMNEYQGRHLNKRSIADDIADEPRIRRDFRQVFLYETTSIDENGKSKVEVQLPERLTTWLITGFAMNDKNGFALAEPVHITTEKQMFIQLALPHSIKTHDIVKIDVTVVSLVASQKPINVDVTLVAHDDRQQYFEFIENVNTKNPQSIRDREMTKTISIPQNSAATTFFYIRAQRSGEMKIKIKAISAMASDVVEETINVESTTPSTTTTLKPAVSFNYPIDQNFFKYLIPTQRDSDQERFTKFATNIEVFKLLKERNLLTSELVANGIEYITTGYQNMLRYYRNEDGSFKSPNAVDDNVWTTAHVIKLFAQIRDMQIVQIDNSFITKALDYLMSQQGVDGEFTNSKKSNYLKHQDVTMTAFGVSAFLDNFHLTNGKYNNVMNSGLEYINQNMNFADSNYATAISAYAFALVNQTATAESLLNKLNYNAILENNFKYWSNRGPVCASLPNCIEITAYVLLTHAKLNKFNEGIPIENWLIIKKNFYGKYGMTDGTILALKALAEFAKLRTNDVYDENKKYGINAPEVTTSKDSIINQNGQNNDEQQQKNTDDNKIKVDNLEHINLNDIFGPELKTKDNNNCRISTEKNVTKNFDLDVILVSKDDFTMTLKVCAKFISDAKIGNSLITLMDIQAPSGYIFDVNNDLSRQKLSGLVTMKIEDEGAKGRILFNSFTTTEVCPALRFTKISNAINGQKSIVQIHDYYDVESKLKSIFIGRLLATTYYTIVCGDL